MTQCYRHDVLIIGSGAAGLSLALRLRGDLSVAVIAKRELAEGNTLYAPVSYTHLTLPTTGHECSCRWSAGD